MNISNYNFFQEQGYIIFDAVSPEDLAAFKASLHSIILLYLNNYALGKSLPDKQLTLEEQCDHGLATLRAANPDYPLAVQAAISRSPEYYRLCSNPQIMGIVRDLLVLEHSPLYFTNNGIIFTNPNDSSNQRSCNIEISWHKDTFFTIPKSRFLQIWIPVLHDATPEIGTLQVCPGSHLAGIGKQHINLGAQYDHRFTMDMDEVSQYTPKDLPVKLGQALVFDGRLIHRSGKNTSKQIRTTMIGMVHDVSCRDFAPLYVDYHYSKQTPEDYFYEVFGHNTLVRL